MSLFVVGLGSQLSGDDAIGLVLVDAIRARFPAAAVTCDAWPAADALTIAHDLLAQDGPVVVVDCADMGLRPGSYRLLSLDEVRLHVKHSPVSVHGIGLAEALELARILGHAQPVHLFGVQPYRVAPGTSLTPELEAHVPALSEALAREVRRLTTAATAAPEGAL
jgi:hydrogenase maturation protease